MSEKTDKDVEDYLRCKKCQNKLFEADLLVKNLANYIPQETDDFVYYYNSDFHYPPLGPYWLNNLVHASFSDRSCKGKIKCPGECGTTVGSFDYHQGDKRPHPVRFCRQKVEILTCKVEKPESQWTSYQ